MSTKQPTAATKKRKFLVFLRTHKTHFKNENTFLYIDNIIINFFPSHCYVHAPKISDEKGYTVSFSICNDDFVRLYLRLYQVSCYVNKLIAVNTASDFNKESVETLTHYQNLLDQNRKVPVYDKTN